MNTNIEEQERPNNDVVEAAPVERLVSLTITDKTNLTQQVIMFTDGEAGHFTQRYEICADGEKTGVVMLVEGNSEKKSATKTFLAKGNDYEKPKDAFIAAGHQWLKES